MELNDSNAKPEESRQSMTFDIDLNEMPICSPREALSGSGGGGGEVEVAPPPLTAAGLAAGEGNGNEKGKVVLLDINALPSDLEGEDESGGFVNSGMRDTSIGNSNNDQVTHSNLLFVGNRFDLMKTSACVSSIVKSDPVDISQQGLNFGRNLREPDICSVFMGRQWASDYSAPAVPFLNLSEMFLQALREFVFDNHGVLEDGWRVEFFYCRNRCKTLAVYCSPDGNKFESMFDVACHLGLVSKCNSVVAQDRSDGFALVQNRLPLQKRRKESLILSRTKDLKEFQENLKSNFTGKLTLATESLDAVANKLSGDFRVMETSSEETGGSGSSYCNDRFPLQFEDFFLLSVGEVDPRPSYHNTSQILPIGYKSSWHDKITGSLFMCGISDGGDCGPVFKVQRYPCSTQPLPIGSTVLSRSSFHSDNSKTGGAFDMNDHEDINFQMIFSDSNPSHLDFDVLSSFKTTVEEMSNFQPRCGLKADSNCIENAGERTNNNKRLGDDIGEFLVEGRSSSSVWKMVSQNFVRACHEVYKQTGMCQFCCMHDAYGLWSSCLLLENIEDGESTDPLAKFCHLSGPLSATRCIQSSDELTSSCNAVLKWLDQDRFGLDVEFVQEIIEQLSGVHACSDYIFLNQRSDKSKLQTVASGFLLAKRKCYSQGNAETDSLFRGSKRPRRDMVENPFPKDFCPPGKPLSSKLQSHLIGDVLQSWELLWRFSEVLGLQKPLSFKDLEEELLHCYSYTFAAEAEPLRENAKERVELDAYHVRTNEIFMKAHCSLLKILLTELQSKLAAFVDPTLESGESRSRKRRKKEADNLIFAKKRMLDLLPVNELTWPELARRYVLIVSSTGGNLDSVEIVSRESCKVFRCLQGHSGPLGGSLPGVAGMEADALLLAEATKRIFGSSKNINDHMDDHGMDAPSACKKLPVNDEIPEWAKVLEPVRKLPTNVGARIRKRIYEALEKNPPEWARRILEHSISKEVYKGNASGPTKKAVLALLADVHGVDHPQKPNRKRKNKNASNLSDVIMKQCRKVLRRAAAADEEKVFCNLLGRTLLNTSDNDDEGLLGFPTMVSRPLDFRTIDLRLAFGAYGGSHEAFLEDVREVWHHIRTAHADQSDLVCLAERLSQNFEELYEKEVLALVHKLMDYDTVECLSSIAKKEMEQILEHASDIPKAPWDEGVCKVCGVDKDDDNVLLCDKCDSGYHTYCLNPPLTRVPEGNWYCPSCITDRYISQSASQSPQFISRCQKRRHRGEFTHGFWEILSNLVTTMEVKDYWEYSLEERVFLLKFLGDEVLNSANIREHLEQCAPISNDLQQKLRSLSAEWKNLKLREEILAEKVAKMNVNLLNVVGKSGTGKMAVVLPDCDKLLEQPLHRNNLLSSLSSDLEHLDCLQWHRAQDFIKQPYWFYSHNVLEKHSTGFGSQFIKIPDSEFYVSQHSGKENGLIFENTSSHTRLPCADEFSRQNKFPSIPQQQKYESNGDHAIWRDVDKESEAKECNGLTIPACEVLSNMSSVTFETQTAEHGQAVHKNPENTFTGHPTFTFIQDKNELQGYNLEASIDKNKISILQGSIAHLDAQLQKASLRKEFLGRDSVGRLYWVFSRPGSSPWVVVDGTVIVQNKDLVKEPRDLFSNSLTFSSPVASENLCKFKRYNVSGLTERSDVIPTCSLWFSYQSDAEIEELIRWLRENDPMERDLLESLLQRLKFGLTDPNKAGFFVSDKCQPPSELMHNERVANYHTLVTKAMTALEKKYGPSSELDVTNSPEKWNQNAEIMSKEKMHRCECLEPIWPSRCHCLGCHRSFATTCELKEHKDGKCSPDAHTSLKSKVNNDVLKAKALIRTEQGECSENPRLSKSVSTGQEVGFGWVGFQKDFTSPHDIQEISSRFVTSSSNKDLVREIGLLGSNGIPSFVPCASPYLTDPTLKLALSWKNEVDQSDKPMSLGTWLQQSFMGNVNTSGKNGNDCNDKTKSGIVDGILKETQKNERSCLTFERKDQSLKFCSSKLENANFPAICDSSMRPLVGQGAQILRLLKINLLDMEAILPEEALKPSKACLAMRGAWRAFVKSAKSVFEMVQATIVLENMIKTEYLRNEWWYWSSLSAAAKIATVSSLALRVYTLDAAIIYEKPFPSSPPGIGGKSDIISSLHTDSIGNPKQSSKSVPRASSSEPSDNVKPQSRSGKKRKDSG